jgi:hypothetical protein
VVGSEAGSEGRRSVSETKHTPGPYLFVPAIKGFPGLDRHLVVAVSAQDTPLARLDADNETAEANGRLFAAAPDLLAALEEALQEISGAPDAWCHYCQDTGEGEPQGYCKAQPTCQERLNVKGDRCNRIRAALSKAESR